MVIEVMLFVLVVITVTILFTSPRKDKYRQIVRTLLFPRPPFGADPRGFGSWWYGDWFLGERVNDAIIAGKERYAHKRIRRRRKHVR